MSRPASYPARKARLGILRLMGIGILQNTSCSFSSENLLRNGVDRITVDYNTYEITLSKDISYEEIRIN